MQCLIIVEQNDGKYRAVIPTLPGLEGEGMTHDEAVRNVQAKAEDYLSKVELTNIEIPARQAQQLRQSSPAAVLRIAGLFKGDEQAMLDHIEEIYAERAKQRAESERSADAETSA